MGVDAVVALDSDLDALVDVAEDGSWERSGFFDKKLGYRCGQTSGDLGTDGRCSPGASYDGRSVFSDAGCGHLLAAPIGGCVAAQPPLVQIDELGPCGIKTTAFGYLGAPYEGTVYVESKSGTMTVCSALSGPQVGMHQIGDTLPVTDLPAMTPAHDGLARLQRATLVDDHGQLLDANGFWDGLSGEQCFAAPTLDGKLRCLPNPSNALLVAYADAACTKPIGRWARPDCSSPIQLPLYIEDIVVGAKPAPGRACLTNVRTAYKVGSPQQLAEYYESEGACAAKTASANDKFYQLAPVDPADWVELMERVE